MKRFFMLLAVSVISWHLNAQFAGDNDTAFLSGQDRNDTVVTKVIRTISTIDFSPQNFTAILQGRIAGVNVTGSGQPGDFPQVNIRGAARFSGNGPLIIVDGVPVENISAINPYDISELTVVKDGGALAIYGSRGINGVIEITTKKGSKGLHITYDFLTGSQLPGKGPSDLLSTQEYANLQWHVYANDNAEDNHPIYGPSTQPSPILPVWAANTNWYREITGPASVNVHQVSFNGGSGHVKYLAGFGYHDQDGLLNHTYSRRYSVRFNSEWTVFNDRLIVGENFTVSLLKNNNAEQLGYNPFQVGVYRSQSIIPVYIDEPLTSPTHVFKPGEFGGTGIASRLGNTPNVVADLIRNKDNYNNATHLFGDAYFKLRLLKGLELSSSFGGTFSNSYFINYTFATYESSINRSQASFREGSGFGSGTVWTSRLNYSGTLGSHDIHVFVGTETLKQGNFRNMSAGRSGYFSDAVSFRTLSNGSAITEASSYYGDAVPLKSQFSGLEYGFKKKYLLNLNVRRDKGASYFKPDGSRIYSGVSATWKIGKEDFFFKSSALTDLAIRGSYGKTGNIYAGFESQTIADVGVDLSFWEHIQVFFDWYDKKSTGLLISFAIPESAGPPHVIYLNSGSISNKGIDVDIRYHQSWQEVGFHSELVFSAYRNRINEIGNGIQFFDSEGTNIGNAVRNKVGSPVSSWFGFEVEGIFKDETEVSSSPQQDGAAEGLFRFADANPDDRINHDDRVFIGNPHPDFTLGLNLVVTWRNLDFRTLVYWSQGNEIFNFTKWYTDFWPSYQGQKSKRLLYESWTPEETGASVPKASNTTNFSTNTQICSYYVEDGSYLRMKSLQLGYNFNPVLLNKVHVSSARIFLNMVNLFTLTPYSGLDPEIGNFSGIDMGSYPNARQIQIGLQLGI